MFCDSFMDVDFRARTIPLHLISAWIECSGGYYTAFWNREGTSEDPEDAPFIQSFLRVSVRVRVIRVRIRVIRVISIRGLVWG